MKRKITDLEKKLLENGYVLTQKFYSGKHSEKTVAYMYQNQFKVIYLDKKREKIMNFGFQNVLYTFLDNKELKRITDDLRDFNTFVVSLFKDLPIDKVLQDYNLEIEPPLSNAKGKTFEQLDEENQEREMDDENS